MQIDDTFQTASAIILHITGLVFVTVSLLKSIIFTFNFVPQNGQKSIWSLNKKNTYRNHLIKLL